MKMKKFFFIFCGLISLNVYANGCGGEYQAATGTCRIIGADGKEILYNSTPPSSNGTQSRPQKIIEHKTVHLPSKYGAIALNKNTGIVNGVLNMNSEAEAKRAALKQCKVSSPNASCRSLGVVRNGCIAVASGKHGNNWTLYKAGEKAGLSEQVALNKCEASGAKNCQIIMPEGCSIP